MYVMCLVYFQATDDEKRLEESLVQLFVSQMVKDLDERTRFNLLNPNKENVSIAVCY